MTLGTVQLYVPRGALLLMSEVPLYSAGSDGVSITCRRQLLILLLLLLVLALRPPHGTPPGAAHGAAARLVPGAEAGP